MTEEKKKPDEEEKKPETEEKEPEKTEEKAPDDKQADENGEGAEAPGEEPEAEEKLEGEAPEEEPKLTETDRLRSENLTLRTQLEAMKLGFAPECMEDAVTLAEAVVKREGTDITAALQAVAKKYPEWKAENKSGKSKGGFKVGADSSGGKSEEAKKPESANKKRWNRFN